MDLPQSLYDFGQWATKLSRITALSKNAGGRALYSSYSPSRLTRVVPQVSQSNAQMVVKRVGDTDREAEAEKSLS